MLRLITLKLIPRFLKNLKALIQKLFNLGFQKISEFLMQTQIISLV